MCSGLESVREASSQALQLDEAEHAHLLDVVRTANAERTPRRRSSPQRVRPSVARIAEAMTGIVACVLNGRLDVLYANDLVKALVPFARLADAVPEDVQLGFHLCYGDVDAEHFVQPIDATSWRSWPT